ncbi:Alanine racemase 1 [bacterium HR15]|nr:Alanine racemase 1 [bacterium HR15]
MEANNWLEIDLGALVRNARHLQTLIGRRCALWAVVKADAYGHGAIPVADTLHRMGISLFWVASIGEAIELREAGIFAPIAMFYPPLRDADWDAVMRHGLEVVIESESGYRAALQAAARWNRAVDAHLEIDTGMSRLGWRPEQLPDLLQLWRADHPIRWRSVFTHFACADSDQELTKEQLERFLAVVDRLRAAGFPEVPLHAAASAGLLALPESRLNAVRCGLLLYGIVPLFRYGDFSFVQEELEPVLRWRARVLSVRTIPAGQGVSYGWRFRAKHPMRVATLGVGYADGYPIALSGRTEVLLRGRRMPQIGRICMDMMMVDVSELPDVQPGEVATLIGKEGAACIRVEELAHRLNTTPHELTTRLGKRPTRQILKPAGEFFERDSV